MLCIDVIFDQGIYFLQHNIHKDIIKFYPVVNITISTTLHSIPCSMSIFRELLFFILYVYVYDANNQQQNIIMLKIVCSMLM